MSADQIHGLPVNPRSSSPQEAKIMNAMFGTTQTTSSNSPVRLLVSGIVFFILNLPIVDNFIKSKISATDSVILAVKTGLFLLVLVIVQMWI